MQRLMARSNQQTRILPTMGPDFYSSNGQPDTSQGDARARLIWLAAGSSLTWWQRVMGLRLTPEKCVSRLLLLHRSAFEAEINGRFQAADFFWREALAVLQRLWTRTDVWNSLRADLGDMAMANAEQLRDRITEELFIDTQVGFINGRFEQGDPLSSSDRAFVHLRFVRELLKFNSWSSDEVSSLLDPGIEAELGALEGAKRWDEAISCAKEYLTVIADDTKLRARQSLLYYKRTMERLSAAAKGDELAGALVLAEGIQCLKGLNSSHPNISITYELIGHLQHLHAIKLANAGSLADALVAASEAQTYSPSLEDIGQLIEQLRENMIKLQKEMGKIQEELKWKPNVSLSQEGQRLQREATRGFTPLREYVDTGVSERVAKARHIASAHSVWREVGFKPNIVPSNEQALELYELANEVYRSEALTAEDMLEMIQVREVAYPHLTEIQADQVVKFILRRRRENTSEAPRSEEVLPASVSSKEPASPPLIVTQASASKGDVPFWYWLFGMQNLGIRAVFATAAFCLIAALSMTLVDAWGSQIRSQAYLAVSGAADRGDKESALAEADRFLAAWTFRADDPREEQIRQWRREVAELPNRRIRNAAYERMQNALQRGDREVAMEAAEQFLGAPPIDVADPRWDRVVNVYARDFITWFSELAEPLGDAARVRVEGYKKLAVKADVGRRNP